MDKATISEIIALAWDDETSFDQIKLQFGLAEGEVIRLMRQEMKPSSFRMWRKRVSGRASKHAKRDGSNPRQMRD
jgi:uncharacterized protein (TIGR03643 family)